MNRVDRLCRDEGVEPAPHRARGPARPRPLGLHALVDEHRFVPADLAQARALYEALVAAGVRESMARTILGTLQTLPGSYTSGFHVTMSRYRKELARLDGVPWEKAEIRTVLQ